MQTPTPSNAIQEWLQIIFDAASSAIEMKIPLRRKPPNPLLFYCMLLLNKDMYMVMAMATVG
jgi:hypothetical protein